MASMNMNPIKDNASHLKMSSPGGSGGIGSPFPSRIPVAVSRKTDSGEGGESILRQIELSRIYPREGSGEFRKPLVDSTVFMGSQIPTKRGGCFPNNSRCPSSLCAVGLGVSSSVPQNPGPEGERGAGVAPVVGKGEGINNNKVETGTGSRLEVPPRKPSPSCAANFPEVPVEVERKSSYTLPVQEIPGPDVVPPGIDQMPRPEFGTLLDALSVETLHDASAKPSAVSLESVGDSRSGAKMPAAHKSKEGVESSPASNRKSSGTQIIETTPNNENLPEKAVDDGQNVSKSASNGEDDPQSDFDNVPPVVPPKNNFALPVIHEGQPMETIRAAPAPHPASSKKIENDSENAFPHDHDHERHPAFQCLVPKFPQVEQSASQVSTGSIQKASTSASAERRTRILPAPTKRGRTYENLFYQKKAFDKMGPPAIRSTSKEYAVAPYNPLAVAKGNPFQLPTTGPACVTKIITEVISEEYEEAEESCKKIKEGKVSSGTKFQQDNSKLSSTPKAESNQPPSPKKKPTIKKSAPPKKVTITEDASNYQNDDDEDYEDSLHVMGPPPTPSNKSPAPSTKGRSTSRGKAGIKTGPPPPGKRTEDECEDFSPSPVPSSTHAKPNSKKRGRRESHGKTSTKLPRFSPPSDDELEEDDIVAPSSSVPPVPKTPSASKKRSTSRGKTPKMTPSIPKTDADEPDMDNLSETTFPQPSPLPRKRSPSLKTSSTNRKRSKSRSGKVPSRIPQLVLPGHGDPRLQRLLVKSSNEISARLEADDFPEVPSKTEATLLPGKAWSRKCNRLKNLLKQSERTIRYLTELITIKEGQIHELKDSIDTCASGDDWTTKDRSTNTSKRQSALNLNPLLGRALAEGSEHNAYSSTPATNACPSPPRATNTTTPYPIPKFDLDEFIRKFFSHILFTEDYNKLNQSEPFEYAQLFRAAVAARDCMAQAVKEKLKYGYHVLKRRYEILLAMKASSDERLDESYYLELVDAHRRFVRFIYYYLKSSLQDVENFEQTYIPLRQRNASHPMKYSKETTMIIDGVNYSGVFIPLGEVAKED